MPVGGKSDVRRRTPQHVMAGLDPAIPTVTGIAKDAVPRCYGAGGDGRVKPGHDGLGGTLRTSLFPPVGISITMLAIGRASIPMAAPPWTAVPPRRRPRC